MKRYVLVFWFMHSFSLYSMKEAFCLENIPNDIVLVIANTNDKKICIPSWNEAIKILVGLCLLSKSLKKKIENVLNNVLAQIKKTLSTNVTAIDMHTFLKHLVDTNAVPILELTLDICKERNVECCPDYIFARSTAHPNVAMTKMLLQRKKFQKALKNANPFPWDSNERKGNTHLHNVCCYRARPEIVEWVLVHTKHLINTQNDLDQTPLHYLLKTFKPTKNVTLFKIVKILIEAGADPNIRSKENKTAFDYAQNRSDQNVINLLRDHQKGTLT